MDIQDKIKEGVIGALVKCGIEANPGEIVITASNTRDHGDYTTNIAMRKAKVAGKKPVDFANELISLMNIDGIEKIEVCAPGFINFFLKSDELGSVVSKIIEEGEKYGSVKQEHPIKIDIEYVSANPTGTLHLGHARGAAIGDALSRIYKKAGYDVTREYYVNDAGNQINNLAKSLRARYLEICGIECEFPEDGYHGEEIIETAKKIYEEKNDSITEDTETNFDYFKQYGINVLLDAIKKDLHEFRVDQDVYTSEKSIRDRGDIEKVLEQLKPYCYEQDGALFLNTTKDGDDKDRVLVKSDGSYTYLLPDIAYHADKYNRGFDELIDLFGADHHGYVARLKSALTSLGYDASKFTVSLVQMVRLFKDGEEFKMSKRTGNAISMKELVDECGVDSVRYFFVSRSGNSHLDFDIDLAKTLGSENPVYYAQYTHARLCGIMFNGEKFMPFDGKGDLLVTTSEKDLLLLLKEYPETVKIAASEKEPYKITNYVHSLSVSINEFYTKCRVLDDQNISLSKQRLALVKACEIVLKDALSLIGVSAPERMTSLSEKED